MTQHKFILEPYKGRQSRQECPNCGKREFAQYVDAATNIAINKVVGRCNRESSCGYHLTPKEWFADHPTTEVYHRSRPIQAIQPPPPKPPDFLNFDMVEVSVNRTLSLNGISNFTRWLTLNFDAHTMERTIWERLVKDYQLGSTTDRGTIFWQIDQQGKVRTGQILYHNLIGNFEDCKRDHSKLPDWIHSRLKKAGKLSEDFNMVQCLFGEHLLTKYPEKVVALVEGQKNAVIGAGVCPQWVWVASAGKSGLSAERLRPLKGRKVIVFADLDAHQQWVEKLPHIALKVGFVYSIFPSMIEIATEADRTAGFDVADYLLCKFEKQKQNGN